MRRGATLLTLNPHQGAKAGLCKMVIRRECINHPVVIHDGEGNAVCE